MSEQYANNAATTLNGTITSGALSLVVLSATAFPTTGNFQIIIEDEIIQVTAVAGTTFTIVRGREGTTAAAHSSGATVTQVLTRDSLLRVGSRIHHRDTYANRPAAQYEGRIFLPSNGQALERDTGSAYNQYGPIWPLDYPPAVASWTQVNPGAATFTETAGGIRIAAPAASGNSRRMLTRAIPTVPYKITALVIPEIHNVNFNMCGMGWRESGTGKIMYAAIYFVAAPTIRLSSTRATGPTGGQTDYATEDGYFPRDQWFLQIEDDNTNRIVRYSFNGVDFITLHTRARTDFDGGAAVTIDQNFMFCDAINAGAGVQATFMSWVIA